MAVPPGTLVLVRHAKAGSLGSLGDSKRVLAPRGRRQAAALGPMLVRMVGPFDRALVSSALRTRETYRLLAGDSDAYPRPRVMDELYQASARQLLGILQRLDEKDRRVLVVGHEPTMSTLAYMLHDARDAMSEEMSRGIPTSTACIIDVPVAWSELDRNRAHVREVVRPSRQKGRASGEAVDEKS